MLDTLSLDEALVNDDDRISLEDDEPVLTHYDLPRADDDV